MNSKVSLPMMVLALAAPAAAQVTMDGSTAGDGYGPPRAVQGTQTGFGDNMSELDAAYTTVDGGRFYITLTGNLEDNFNKLEIFIDSKSGGENVFTGVPAQDNVFPMVGLTFDSGFEADYHLILRRGNFMGDRLDFNIGELGTPNFSEYFDVFGGVHEGSGTTGTGPANGSPIDIAYDNSNLAGVLAGNGRADQAAAAAVTTGIEIGIDLADIGSPTGDIDILAFVNGSNHDFASNQFLGTLQAPQGNLGSDGFGNFIMGVCVFDLNTFGLDQFFEAPTADSIGTNYCLAVPNSTGSPALMEATGSTSVAANNVNLVSEPVPNQPGLFFFGPNQTQIPFGNGFRCIASPITRINPPGPPTGSTAMRTIDLPTFGITAGTQNFQYWYRDPAAGGALFNLSDGLNVVFVP